MEIYCGLCGQKAHQLFSHLRDVHEMGPDSYSKRCPGAPLISEDLGLYLKANRIVAGKDGLKVQIGLFGVEFLSSAAPAGRGSPDISLVRGYRSECIRVHPRLLRRGLLKQDVFLHRWCPLRGRRPGKVLMSHRRTKEPGALVVQYGRGRVLAIGNASFIDDLLAFVNDVHT